MWATIFGIIRKQSCSSSSLSLYYSPPPPPPPLPLSFHSTFLRYSAVLFFPGGIQISSSPRFHSQRIRIPAGTNGPTCQTPERSRRRLLARRRTSIQVSIINNNIPTSSSNNRVYDHHPEIPAFSRTPLVLGTSLKRMWDSRGFFHVCSPMVLYKSLMTLAETVNNCL